MAPAPLGRASGHLGMVGSDSGPNPPYPPCFHSRSLLPAAAGQIRRKKRDFHILARCPPRRDTRRVALGTQEPITLAENGRGHPGNRSQRR